MRPNWLTAALLLALHSSSAGLACDSYHDDMSLASVLAEAVAVARANGTLETAGAPASEARTPEQAAAPTAAGTSGAAAAPKS